MKLTRAEFKSQTTTKKTSYGIFLKTELGDQKSGQAYSAKTVRTRGVDWCMQDYLKMYYDKIYLPHKGGYDICNISAMRGDGVAGF